MPSPLSLAVLLVPVLALAGCEASVAVGTISTETYVTITDRGVGTIDTTTRYDGATLRAALPNAEIRTIETALEDRTVNTFAAFENGVQVVQIYRGPDGNVGEIHGVTQHLAGPNGERIGMTMAEAGIRREDCRAGRNLWAGMAVCPARGARHVTLVFAIPGYLGPFDALPNAEDLKRAELQRIVWRA